MGLGTTGNHWPLLDTLRQPIGSRPPPAVLSSLLTNT